MKKNRLLILFSLCLLGFFTRAHAQQIIETVAGTGASGFSGDGAAATAARVDNPYQLALDKYGDLYIADQTNNRVRMIDTNGIISTVAGTGTAGYSGDAGDATAARLSQPCGVAVDTSGNLYIADFGNNRIRIVSAGIINTIAGTGTGGFSGDGGLATAAEIRGPRCITLDDTGNIYFSDATNQRVREISYTTGDIMTIAGTGTGGFTGDGGDATAAELNGPRGVAVDASGNVYIADMTNNRIRMVTAGTGIINTIAGTGTAGYSGDGAAATLAELKAAAGVSVDGAGNIYIADVSNNRIRLVDASGNINTIAGNGTAGYAGDGGAPASAELNGPIAVAITSNGYYISDRTSQRIRIVRPNSAPIFVDSTTQFLSVCENSGITDISAMLAVIDSDVDQTETWSVYTMPVNGTLSASDAEASTGGSVTPVGLNYTPITGYSGADSFIVQATDGFATIYDTFYVKIPGLPDVGVITGGNTICTGGTDTLADTAGGSSGTWVASNTNATVDAFGDVTGVSGGTDTIYYILSNGCGADTASYVVTVSSFFVPSVSISADPGDTSCYGLSVTYIANPVNGGTAPVYAWSVNGTYMAAGDTFMYTPNDGDVIAVTLTSNAACALAPGTATASVTMVVNAGFTPGITIGDGATGDTVCIFTTVTYTATSTYGGSSPTYTWNVNGTPYALGDPFYYAPEAGDVISCTLTSSNLCATPSSVTSNSISMTVNSVEVPSITLSATPGDTVCADHTVTVATSITYGGSAPFIRWTKNGINVATGPDFTFTPVTGDSITATLISSSSCASPDSTVSTTLYLIADSSVAPSVSIYSLLGAAIAVDAVDTLVAEVSGATYPTYQWEVDGVAVPGATSAIFVISDTADAVANVTCVVESGDACHNSGSASTVITIGSEAVQQLPLTNTNITLIPDPNRGNFLVQGNVPADLSQVTVEINDVAGRMVYSGVLSVQNGKISSQVMMDEQQPGGMYFMHLFAGNVNQVIRFVVAR